MCHSLKLNLVQYAFLVLILLSHFEFTNDLFDFRGKDHASARYVYTRVSPIPQFMFHKDDDDLLDYLNEDGQSIEPTSIPLSLW